MELTVEELFAQSIEVLVLRENTASTSLSFIDRIWNLLSRKARHQVRIYLLFFGFAAGICSQGEHFLTKICCDLSHLELCGVHWNCVHIYRLFKLTSSPILRGERYSNRNWFFFTCGFVARSIVWERFGSCCSQGEHLFDKDFL